MVYNMLIMSLIYLAGKHRSTYEAFSINRPGYDELKGSSDGKQSKSEFHDEQRFNELKEQ